MKTIKNIRKVLGLPQSTMAGLLGIPRTTFIAVEQGNRDMPLAALYKLHSLETIVNNPGINKNNPGLNLNTNDSAEYNKKNDLRITKCREEVNDLKIKLERMKQQYQQYIGYHYMLSKISILGDKSRPALQYALLRIKNKIEKCDVTAQEKICRRIFLLEAEICYLGRSIFNINNV